jgi:predicted AlkP superfamily pyrophosphatase or phosphodiesterase
LDFFQGRKFSFYKWPFFVTEEKKKLIFKYENDEARLKRIFSEKGKEIYYTQLMKVDKTIHRFGKESIEVKKTLKNMDLLLEKYVKRFISENPEAEIFLWGDHSLANIKNYINIQEILPKNREYLCFIEGTTACFWFKNDEIKNKVLDSLKIDKRIKILNAQIAKKYKIPLSKKYGDLVAYVEKSNYFFPNYYQKKDKDKFKAMHGYPDDREMNGFFATNKKIKLDKILKMNKVIGVLQ